MRSEHFQSAYGGVSCDNNWLLPYSSAVHSCPPVALRTNSSPYAHQFLTKCSNTRCPRLLLLWRREATFSGNKASAGLIVKSEFRRTRIPCTRSHLSRNRLLLLRS